MLISTTKGDLIDARGEAHRETWEKEGVKREKLVIKFGRRWI